MGYESIGLTQECPLTPGRDPRLEVGARACYEYDEWFARRTMHQQLFNVEVCAAEICAMVILRFPDIPVEMASVLALQAIEEARHAEVLLAALHREGGDIGETPISLDVWNASRREVSAAACLGVEQVIGEGFAIGGDLYFSALYAAKGRPDLSTQYSALHIDEVNHARNGLYWFRRLAGDGADALLTELEARTNTAPYAGEFFASEVRAFIGFTPEQIERQRRRANPPLIQLH